MSNPTSDFRKHPYSQMLAQERYQRDPDFHTLVDMIYMMIEKAQYTPTELREAVILASIKYEQVHMRPSYVIYRDMTLRILEEELKLQRMTPEEAQELMDRYGLK